MEVIQTTVITVLTLWHKNESKVSKFLVTNARKPSKIKGLRVFKCGCNMDR